MREKRRGSPRPPRSEAPGWPSFRKGSPCCLFGAAVSSLPSLCGGREGGAGDTGVRLSVSPCRGGKCSYCPASVLSHGPRECSRRPPPGSSERSVLKTGQLPGLGSEAGPSDIPVQPRTYRVFPPVLWVPAGPVLGPSGLKASQPPAFPDCLGRPWVRGEGRVALQARYSGQIPVVSASISSPLPSPLSSPPLPSLPFSPFLPLSPSLSLEKAAEA